MRIYDWTNGFFLQRDADGALIAVGPALAQFGVPDRDVFLRYWLRPDPAPDPEPDTLPEVELSEIAPLFLSVASGDDPATAAWLPVPSDATIRIGRATLSAEGTTHDLLEFELPGRNASFHFLLDGDPLPDIAAMTPAEVAALDWTAGPVPAGAAAGPNQGIHLDSLVPDLGFTPLDTPQVIRAGHVAEDAANGWHEIGTFRGMEGAGDGSVTALNGAWWTLSSHTGPANTIYLGGWGAEGHVTGSGAGTRLLWQGAHTPDSQLTAEIGVDGGFGRVTLLDSAHWFVSGPFQSDTSLGRVDMGLLDGRAEVLLDTGRFTLDRFVTSYLTLGDAEMILRGGASAHVEGTEFARLHVGTDTPPGRSGTLLASDGSTVTVVGLDELLIGPQGGTGFVTFDASDFSGRAGPQSDAMMWVQVGSDGGNGRLNVANEGQLQFINSHYLAESDTRLLIEIGKGAGPVWDPGSGEMVQRGADGMLMADQSGRISVSGFDATRIEVGTEGGTGALWVIGDSRLNVHDSATTELVIGNGTGNGSIYMSSGGYMNLGGGASIQVGGTMDADVPGWLHAGLELFGPGNVLTGFATLQAGTPLAEIDPMVTPRGFATVTVDGGSMLGADDADLHFGVMSELNLYGHGYFASLKGNVFLGGTTVMMGEMGGAYGIVDGDLTVAESLNFLRMTVTEDWYTGATQADQLIVTRDFNLAGGTLDMVFDPAWGYEFSAGESHRLIQFGRLVEGEAELSLTLGHHIFHPDFAWMFTIDRVDDGALGFTAITAMDGSGEAALDLRDGDSALALQVTRQGLDLAFTGGGLHRGLAHNIEVIYATGLDDVIDLTGYGSDVAIHGGAGDDHITGGQGVNTAVFSGARSDYAVTVGTEAVTVTDLRDGSPDGTDTLVDIQRLHFLGDGSSEEIAPASVSLSGSVTGRDGAGLADTLVSFTPHAGEPAAMMTGADGLFGFDAIAHGASGHLDASRDHTAGDPGLGIPSAINALRLALGLGLSNGGEITPHDWIAADFTGDGRIELEDGIEILRGALGLHTDHAPRWVFVDAAADLSGLHRTHVVYDSGIDLAALEADVDGLALTGILVGHVQEYTLPG